MKKIVFILMGWFLITNVSFANDVAVDQYDNKSYIRYSNTDFDSDILWDDKVADAAEALMRHSVKIQENVSAQDISGMVINVDDVTSGSGTVIAIKKEVGKSLVLTAEHVCVNYFYKGEIVADGRYKILSVEKEIVTFSGKHVKARVVDSDANNDVCLMEADGIVGTPAKLSSFFPPLGSEIYTAGAPAGYWGKELVNIVKGFYIGIREKRICVPGQCFENMLQFSFPIVGGMSGSGVYYKGELFGIITIGTDSYEHIGWGPGLSPINKIIDGNLRKWLND